VSAAVAGSFVKVLITDTGRGMSPEAQQLLFHKFQQAGNSLLTRDTARGTGLGLYISKMIVEDMGGAVKLEQSVEGKGSVFSFTVPIATPEREAITKALGPQIDVKTGLSTTTKKQ
jgi:signal transduction histidine kinase